MTAFNIAVDRDEHVGDICFNSPPHNFASAELLGELADAVEVLDRDPAIRCLLLRSEGKSFCAGADLQRGDASADGDDGVAVIAQFYAQAERLFRRRKPMVAAVQGAAIGAGLGLALTADFRIAAPAARFSANFVRLGFHPGFGLTRTLPRLIGAQHASWMMLSAERIKAEQALAWGLVDRIGTDEGLATQAQALAREIAANAPLSLIDVRATLTGDLADEIAATMRFELSRQARLRATSDYAEGVAAVFERREPQFTGS